VKGGLLRKPIMPDSDSVDALNLSKFAGFAATNKIETS